MAGGVNSLHEDLRSGQRNCADGLVNFASQQLGRRRLHHQLQQQNGAVPMGTRRRRRVERRICEEPSIQNEGKDVGRPRLLIAVVSRLTKRVESNAQGVVPVQSGQ